MTVFNGKCIDVFNFREEDVEIEAIAHALARECRYMNFTREHYSVAEHSIHVAELCPLQLQLAGLLHDASEAYLLDLNPTLKYKMPVYMELEKTIQETIFRRFNIKITKDQKKTIKHADKMIGATEIGIVIDYHRKFFDWVGTAEISISTQIQQWDYKTAEKEFLEKFKQYTKDQKC